MRACMCVQRSGVKECAQNRGPCPVTDNVNCQQSSANAAPCCVELLAIINSAGEFDVHPHEENGEQGKDEAEEDDDDPSRSL